MILEIIRQYDKDQSKSDVIPVMRDFYLYSVWFLAYQFRWRKFRIQSSVFHDEFPSLNSILAEWTEQTGGSAGLCQKQGVCQHLTEIENQRTSGFSRQHPNM